MKGIQITLIIFLNLIGLSSFALCEPIGGIALEDSELFQIRYDGKTYTCGLVNSIWVPGKIYGIKFLPASKEIKNNKKALKKAKRLSERKKITKKINLVKTYLDKGKIACQQVPDRNGNIRTPIPTVSPTPASTNPNFDLLGNLTAVGKAAFQVPSSMSASANRGIGTWNRKCASCHGSRPQVIRPNTYPAVLGRITQAPMFFMIPDEVNEQEVADIIAYRNF